MGWISPCFPAQNREQREIMMIMAIPHIMGICAKQWPTPVFYTAQVEKPAEIWIHSIFFYKLLKLHQAATTQVHIALGFFLVNYINYPPSKQEAQGSHSSPETQFKSINASGYHNVEQEKKKLSTFWKLKLFFIWPVWLKPVPLLLLSSGSDEHRKMVIFEWPRIV